MGRIQRTPCCLAVCSSLAQKCAHFPGAHFFLFRLVSGPDDNVWMVVITDNLRVSPAVLNNRVKLQVLQGMKNIRTQPCLLWRKCKRMEPGGGDKGREREREPCICYSWEFTFVCAWVLARQEKCMQIQNRKSWNLCLCLADLKMPSHRVLKHPTHVAE